ncbi:MAG: hypothetical protein WKG07_12975 [Hymenobacter sp.]
MFAAFARTGEQRQAAFASPVASKPLPPNLPDAARARRSDQAKAAELAGLEHLVLLAGHYEGIDYRVREQLIDEEISIGDYVLTGGELPALVLIDAVVRMVPGVLGDERSGQEETFSEALDGGLEYPHYTARNVHGAGRPAAESARRVTVRASRGKSRRGGRSNPKGAPDSIVPI